MLQDGIKTAGLFVGGLFLGFIILMVFFFGSLVYISYGENTWEVLKTLL